MRRVKPHDSAREISDRITARLRKHDVKLTLGGEPSYVPVDPIGAEWNITALGPTKLRYTYALAHALMKHSLPGAVAFFSPGKSYPGEQNPRWAVNLLWNRDGSLIDSTGARNAVPTLKTLAVFQKKIAAALKVPARWIVATDPLGETRIVRVIPLDHDGKKWITDAWPFGRAQFLTLLAADGPAGLRLPLNTLPPDALKRALVMEIKDDGLHIFFPPLLQKPFLALLKHVTAGLRAAGIGKYLFEGYIPHDETGAWSKLSLTPDPGVLEVNLPPCATAVEYGWWLGELEKTTAITGLRSFKQPTPERALGTGGGNHLLFGGPSLDENPFFKHPQWITSILRYWQHHPSLSYLFTGDYVGPSSQAPRPDESARELYDLEMAYQFLEKLEPDRDQRYLISETLRHLHTDGSGNTHRSEISFDKFWNTAFDGGCRGLVEFRAIETLPRAEWMAAVALLWKALAVFLFEKKYARPLIEHGSRLHDHFFLPTMLWKDFEDVLRDLRAAGLRFDVEMFRAIWDWRFPRMLAFERGAARLIVRKACEGWPLLCEQPLEGGSTSRFVDTSIERIECVANEAFARAHRIVVQGRELKLEPFPDRQFGAGLRYRRTALYPSLHPGITPHIPLFVTIVDGDTRHVYKMEENRRVFEPCDSSAAPRIAKQLCKKLRPELLTCDLRL